MNYFEYCARQKALDLYTESEEDFTRYGYYTGKSNKTYHEFEASGKFTDEQLVEIRYCLNERLIDSAWIDHPEYSPEKIKAIGHCLMWDYECMYPAYTLTNPDLTADNIYDLYWFGYKGRIYIKKLLLSYLNIVTLLSRCMKFTMEWSFTNYHLRMYLGMHIQIFI